MGETYYTHGGALVSLGPALKQGGEGVVHRIEGDDLNVAKLYHRGRLGVELEAKLVAMAASPPIDPTWSTQRHRSIAWVQNVLYREPGRVGVAGFTMPLIDTNVFREAHAYFDPEDRTSRFGGDFTWRHLVTAAQNLASCVAAIHAQRHRIGDLRETNVLVSSNSLVCLIDCDSFEIHDAASGKAFPTRVGTGEYLPPELQGVNFGDNDVDRYHSDLFALGVIIFKLLMQGVHPYQARGPAVATASSTEAKIKLGQFPYDGGRGVEPPAYAPEYSILPKSTRKLLRACFVEGHNSPASRPAAEAWFRELGSLAGELRQCKQNENHWHRPGIACPWCETQRRGAPDPFPKPMRVGHQVAATAVDASLDSPDKRREFVASYLEMALADGRLSPEEERHIASLGLQVGLSEREVAKLIAKEMKRRPGMVRSGDGNIPATPSNPARAPKPPSAGAVNKVGAKRGIPTPLSIALALFALSVWGPFQVGRELARTLGVDSFDGVVAPVLANCGRPFYAAAFSQWAAGTLAAVVLVVAVTVIWRFARSTRPRVSRLLIVSSVVLLGCSIGSGRWLIPRTMQSGINSSIGGYVLHQKRAAPGVCVFMGRTVAWTRDDFGIRWAYQEPSGRLLSERRVPGSAGPAVRLVSGWDIGHGKLLWQHRVRDAYQVGINFYLTQRADYAYAVVTVDRVGTGTTLSTAKLRFRTGRIVGGGKLPRRFWRH